MAEEQGVAGEHLANGEDTLPQVAILSQYVKDLSFENPNAPAVYQWQEQPQIAVDVNIATAKLGDEIFEVSLRLDVRATANGGQTAFAVDLMYAGLIAIRNVDDEQAQPFLLAEAPRLLFPFARQIISHAVQDGGFPPLMLDPIDFAGLYQQRAQEPGGLEGGEAGALGQA
jgi:preprotein translocase subunit SecB